MVQAFAFDTLELNRLELEVFSHNPRAFRSYEKAGFQYEGKRRQALYFNGTYSDVIIMGILREEYNHMMNTDAPV
ncbi:GNAT family protein, partial [Bacillus safensis]|uniref:N-acetyltransferase domain-containing protein n=2 Tax=Bacillaceae TaxID=186817 RepID=A0A5S9M197_BACIA